MKKVLVTFAVLAFATPLFAQDDPTLWVGGVDGSRVEGEYSLFTVTGQGDLTGIDLQSPGGFLKPAESAAPFLFNLQNEPTAVVYAQIPGSVKLDGEIVLDSGYATAQVTPEGTTDLAAGYGLDGVLEPVAFPIETPETPEPASGLLAAFGLLGLLGLRRRR